MTVSLDNYFPVLLLCFAAVSLLPAPKWARYIVGGACALAAVMLLVRNLSAST